MKIKDGVEIALMSKGNLIAIAKVNAMLEMMGKSLTITSLTDGKHRKNSKHYSGDAFDVRIWSFDNAKEIATKMQNLLGEDYDVVLEKTHIHVEYDPD